MFFLQYLPVEDRLDKTILSGNTPESDRKFLFLCSEEISCTYQTSDVWWFDPTGIASGFYTIDDFSWQSESHVENSVVINNGKEILKVPRVELITVLGELSPDIDWAQAGMKFEPGDIHFGLYSKESGIAYSISKEMCDQLVNRNDFIPVVRLRCPTCQRIH